VNSERYSASRLVGQNRFTSKWAKLAKCSQDTALRDIENLVQKGGVLMKDAAGGRSTSYSIAAN
jgi:Fic family protein